MPLPHRAVRQEAREDDGRMCLALAKVTLERLLDALSPTADEDE